MGPILLTALIFSGLAIVHKVLLPGMYSAYLVFKTEENAQKTARSTLIRTLYIFVISIVLHCFFGFSTKQICCGIGLACFLNVWPAIIQYKVLKINSKQKLIQLLGYVSFIALSVLVVYVTIEICLPILIGVDKWEIHDNKVIELLMSICMIILSIPVEVFIAKLTSLVVVLDLDTFHEEVEILENQLTIPNRVVERNKYIINDIAKENNISYELLAYIIRFEDLYRGALINKILENLVVKFDKNRAIKKDYSIGICQIKISTAQKVLRDTPFNFIDNLMKEDYNIDLCGKYLKSLINEYNIGKETNDYLVEDFEDVYEYIAVQYLGGIQSDKSMTVLLYSAVLRSEVEHISYYGWEKQREYRFWVESIENVDEETYSKVLSSFTDKLEVQFPERFYYNGEVRLQINCYDYDILQFMLEELSTYPQLQVRHE